ncbi:MAG: phosphoribosylaminoimidazolesuccinocarboxamide synthase [Planctomycetaceae bacterium]|jgi:phosphoribosylaminoimidazole-succinocarboxamide synthase|nr:phosphoribosylaminoimidazolesuccinocarboxamide synthase [Planctomycetaceae bacterium]
MSTNINTKKVILKTEISGCKPKHGKVRDIYEFDGNLLLLVCTDRISAFDWILPTGIPDKGKILNQMSMFWFEKLGIRHYALETDVSRMPFPSGTDLSIFAGRSTLGIKCKTVPIECVVRGYLAGSAWKEYRSTGEICGIKLPKGLLENQRLPEPIFTPSTKAQTGHDENITFDQAIKIVGENTAIAVKTLSIKAFQAASEYALKRKIIIADTKFEFGFSKDELLIIDEFLTPDSSRFWNLDTYEIGKSQPSYDKQFVRDWLTNSGWDKNSPPPELPDNIVMKTREKYIEAFKVLTDSDFIS